MSVTTAFIVPHPPLLIPEVGRGQEKRVENTVKAYEKAAAEIAAIAPETILVISPHSVMYQDYIHISPGESASGDFGQFGAPGVTLRAAYDRELVSGIEEAAQKQGIYAGTLGEKQKKLDHGTMIPLYFINQKYRDYKLVRISISGLGFRDHYAFGRCISSAVALLHRNVVVIASGDLSHRLKEEGPYSYAPEGPEFDREVVAAMQKADFLRFLQFDETFCESAGECGLRSFLIMAGIFDGKAVEAEFLSYEGPFGVGYAVCGFRAGGQDTSRKFEERFVTEQVKALAERKAGEDEYVKLARLSLETYIKEKKPLAVKPELPEDLLDHDAGVFVSLKKDGKLRGCIGTISPTTACVADEIIRNAISAGTGDPRFEPVIAEELPWLVYSVDVLGKAEPVASREELDPERYGVIVEKGRKRGLLLPALEGVKTVEQQLAIALKKAGIPLDEDYTIQRFEVVRHQ